MSKFVINGSGSEWESDPFVMVELDENEKQEILKKIETFRERENGAVSETFNTNIASFFQSICSLVDYENDYSDNLIKVGDDSEIEDEIDSDNVYMVISNSGFYFESKASDEFLESCFIGYDELKALEL
jgi:hypothetical protein